MGTFFWLAVEAGADLVEPAEAGGLGINFNILETNLINLAILLGVLGYFGKGLLGKILAQRRTEIQSAIQEAEQRQREAAEKLTGEQEKLAQARAEVERIRSSAQESAKAAREAVLAQAAQDIQRLKETAARDTVSDQERAIAELRQRVVALALQQAESQIAATLKSEDDQRKLLDRSLSLLGDRS